MSPLAAIFLIVLVDLLGLMMIIPLLPFYAQKFGATPIEVGWLSSSFAFCQLIAGPILGSLSDRHGRKPVLMVSQLGTFVGFLLMARAESLAMVFAARIIDGITAGNISVAQATIADVTPPEKRARAFGILGVAFGLGLLLGPAISGWLAGYDWTYPIYAACALSALSIATTALVLKGGKPQYPGEMLTPKLIRELITRSALRLPLLQFAIFIFIFGFFVMNLAMFIERKILTPSGQPFGPSETGYFFGYLGLIGVVVQGGMIGRLVARFGEQSVARAGFLLDVAGFALLSVAEDLTGLLLAATLFGSGNSLLRPSLTSLITHGAESREQGLLLGLTSSMQSIGQVVAPPLGALLIANHWLSGWALTLSACSVLGLWVSFSRPISSSRAPSR